MKVLATLALGTSLVAAVERVVDLGYSKYAGRVVGDGTTQWLGMRYAAPPLGDLRFRAPADPHATRGVQDASKFGNICIAQSPDDWTNKPTTRFTVGEDCLFVNVFAPSGAREKSKLPVMFYVQGGAFASNSGANFNGSDLARKGDMVVVTINYRVGSWGWLNGEEVRSDGDANNGIRDQIKALEWTRRNIKKFGGDPDHVVLNGASAGAMSLAILMATPAIKDKKKMFKGVFAESAGVIQLDTKEVVQNKFACLAKAVGCESTSGPEALKCLRSVNGTALQTASCKFQPTFDPEIIPSRILLNKIYAQTLRTHPTIFGTTANEGTDFIPPSLPSPAYFRALFSSALPFLSASALDALLSIYASGPQPSFPNAGPYWRAASNAYGDIAFKCPTRILAGTSSWIYNYDVKDPADEASGEGVFHTAERDAIWGPNNTDGNPIKSYLPGGVNEGIVPLMQGYMVSFVRHLDPNVKRVGGAPRWDRGVGGRTLHITGAVGSRMGSVEEVEGEGFEERCRRLGPVIRAAEVVPEEGTIVDLADA